MSTVRPKLQIELTPRDRNINLVIWLLVASMWLLAIWYFNKLPDTIPVHFNAKGDIDRYGSKLILFLLPLILTIVVGLLGLLSKYPHLYNYPVKISEENASYQYTKATRLLRTISLVITCFGVVIMFIITQSAMKKESVMPVWLLPVFIIAMFLPVGYSVYRMRKNSR